MCPGCMTAAALSELGNNPLGEIIALIVKALPGRTSAEPSTPAAEAKDQETEETDGVV